MWVKICGVRSIESALIAEEAGADAIGINLHPPSPRYVSPETAATIAASVSIEVVLVVVNRTLDELREFVKVISPDTIQLHGSESAEFARTIEAELGVSTLRAFRAHESLFEELDNWQPERFILDAYVSGLEGGTGKQVDLKTAKKAASQGQMILAGGLTPGNVADVIEKAHPMGVDVASGVEISAGAQSHMAIREFIRAAKLA